jgi:hypothetical protein
MALPAGSGTMMTMKAVSIRSISVIAGAVLIAGVVTAASQEKKKPSISVRASPTAGFSPLRVSLTAEIKGGADDFQEFYCPTVEWDWGDDTSAESTTDCDPYQQGKSEIRRRYSTTRIFQMAGNFKVAFRLKQKDKIVGYGMTTVQVRPGIRDGGGD